MDRKLGISIYPDKSSIDDMKAYIDKASKYGFKRIFSNLLLPNKSKKEIVTTFKDIFKYSKDRDFEIIVDTNENIFKMFDIKIDDLSFFKNIGADGIRLDGGFSNMQKARLTYNKENLKIEINMSAVEHAIDNLFDYSPNRFNLMGCHNFYPQRHSGISLDFFNRNTVKFNQRKIRTAAFICSKNDDAFGPWPITEGLPTLEMHRDLPIDVQLKHFIAMDSIDDIIISNCYPTEDELKKISSISLTDDGKVDYNKDFFSKKSYMTVSGQLEAEDYALAFGNVYTFGPTFRAEVSNTPRHAAEFWMLEPEMAFADYNVCMDTAEDMIKYAIDYILENAKDEMEFFNKWIDEGLIERLTKLRDSEFARITYTKAIDLLKESGEKFEFPVEWGMDLQTEHERYLSEKIVDGPVFVTDYPKDIKAFYMKRNDDGKTVAAFDMLVPGVGELIGGSQREERYDELVKSMEDNGLKPEEYQNYLDLRRFGTVVHSGFGLGFERAMMYVTGMKNIRDVIAYPRYVNAFAREN